MFNTLNFLSTSHSTCRSTSPLSFSRCILTLFAHSTSSPPSQSTFTPMSHSFVSIFSLYFLFTFSHNYFSLHILTSPSPLSYSHFSPLLLCFLTLHIFLTFSLNYLTLLPHSTFSLYFSLHFLLYFIC